MRVAYDNEGKVWKNLDGNLPQIQAPSEEGDYYYWVNSRNWLLRFYGGWNVRSHPLGVVLTADGDVVKEIPEFVIPRFNGMPETYKSRVGWVQDEADAALIMIVECHGNKSCRTRFDLDDGTYKFLGYDVR